MPEPNECIRVVGAREHNLAGIDVDIPKRRLTVVTGVSGSGRASLVFDTIAAEAQHQLYETLPAFVRGDLPAYDRPAVDRIEHLTAVVTVDRCPLGGGDRSTVGTVTGIAPLLRRLFAREGVPPIGPADAFSFATPAGRCPTCEGLGEITDIDLDAFLDPSRSINEGALLAPVFKIGSWNWQIYTRSDRLDADKPVGDYRDDERHTLLHATSGTVRIDAVGQQVDAPYEGAAVKFRRLYVHRDRTGMGEKTRQMTERFTTALPCPDCAGTRLSVPARRVRVEGHGIAELSAVGATRLLGTLATLAAPGSGPLLDDLTDGVSHLVGIGLGHLSLDRATRTLSGGESQRIRLVRHLAATLTDLLYVIDGPSAGLDPRDRPGLTARLQALRDRGNTVLVIDHDRTVIAGADHVIDLGPGAGPDGGRVVFQGEVGGLGTSGTVTGRHLGARARLKDEVRSPTGTLAVTGTRRHDRGDPDIEIPTGVLTVVSSIAGPGLATLTGAVRDHPEAVIIDRAAFSDDARSTIAEHVLGHRLDGVSITDVLDMTVAEALDRFADRGPVAGVLRPLADVGLGYLHLGEPLSRLSGGEAQRIRLTSHLGLHGALLVLDEPAADLHPAEVPRLLGVLDHLVDERAATVVVIEHDAGVIARADWVIEMGPGDGRDPGRVLFAGTPADLVVAAGSPTAERVRRAVDLT